MSQIWNTEKEKDKEKEKEGRQISEAQRERELERERKKKTKGDIYCRRNNLKFCRGGMIAAAWVKMSYSEKKSEQALVRHFLHKMCN